MLEFKILRLLNFCENFPHFLPKYCGSMTILATVGKSQQPDKLLDKWLHHDMEDL